MLTRLLLPIVLILAFLRGMAQQNDLYTSYSVEEGLPQTTVWSVVQDKPGFLWVATADGICRFDGYKFTVYREGSPESGIGAYLRFYCDSNMGLWTASQNGISIYDPLRDKFTAVFICKQIYAQPYNCILGETTQYIYAGISGYGLIRIDKGSHKATLTGTNKTQPLAAWMDGAIAGDDAWIATGGPFGYVYNIRNNVLDTIKIPGISRILRLNDSELLAASYSTVAVINTRNHILRKLPLKLFDRECGITGILRLSNDEVIIACSAGLATVDIKNEKVVRRQKTLVPDVPGSILYAQCIYRDRSNNIWIGTNGDGLKKLLPPYKPFKHYHSVHRKGGLVKSIYADDTNVYIGYFPAGLDIYNRKDGFERSVATRDGPTTTNAILALAKIDRDHLIYQAGANTIGIVSKSGAVKDLSGTFGKVTQVSGRVGNANPFFLKTDSGYITNIANEYIVSFKAHGDIQPKMLCKLPGHIISCGYMADDGMLWIGTTTGAYRLKNNIPTAINLGSTLYIKSINADKEQHIWVGTTKGVYVLDGEKVIRRYTDSNGLSNQFIYGILRDNDGNMWMSHNRGLSVYLSANNCFRHYEHSDGLQSNEFNTGAYFKAADGELFFGGINGVNSFFPREIRDNPHIPKALITNIKLFDITMKTDTAYWNLHSLTLPYTQNSLSFEFAVPEYSNPAKNQYAYMMEGVDDKWIRSADLRFARYPALSPGHYVFKVRASNNDGIWQAQPTLLVIDIIPPFWQMLWFRLLIGALGVGAAAAVVSAIQRQKHKRMLRTMELRQRIEQERQRISRDLHDTVGTQLSLISNNIEWVTHPLKEITEQEKADKLQFVNDTSREVIATLRETIWALNKQQITLQEFSDKLTAYLQKQITAFPEIELNITEHAGDIVLGPSEALNLFRMCQEAVANALKYAAASEITTELLNNNGKYKISIADNGKGFDIPAVNPAIQNGLENMKYRAREIDCELKIESRPGAGTRITLMKK